MKLQSLTIIFIIIVLPIILVLSSYIGYEIDVINKQNAYNSGVMKATHDAIFSFELNTKNDDYSNNPETKRSNIKAAVKTFENSLSTACNLGLYNNEAIEEYIPAIVFGLYDGFYMYAPSELKKTVGGTDTYEYKHNLRNYVYYSERICSDIVIRYSLDNYVVVSGTFNGTYHTKSGYLINLDKCNTKYTYNPTTGECQLLSDFRYDGAEIVQSETLNYKKVEIDESTGTAAILPDSETSTSAKEYFELAIAFTKWFQGTDKYSSIISAVPGLKTGNSNDPDNENSAFVQHKREVIKSKIETVLNSSITAYAKKTGIDYKMPKFSGEEWERIYNNISVISFVQGMDLGFKEYNGYCVLNSTNSQEYVNPNLMYFTDSSGNYHDIRCSSCDGVVTTGYKIGEFESTKYELTNPTTGDTQTKYYYEHDQYACYGCINSNDTLDNTDNIYNFMNSGSTSIETKKSYYTALARERNKTTKLQSGVYNESPGATGVPIYTITFYNNHSPSDNTIYQQNEYKKGDVTVYPGSDPSRTDIPPDGHSYEFAGWNTKRDGSGTVYDNTHFGHPLDDGQPIEGSLELYAQWKEKCKVTLHLLDEYGAETGSNISIILYKNETVKDYLNTNPTVETNINNYENSRVPDLFMGWYTGINKTGTKWNFDSMAVSRNIDLYPYFWEAHEVYYYEKYEDIATDTYLFGGPRIVYDGNKAVEPSIGRSDDVINKIKYEFIQWNIYPSNTKYDFNTPVTSDIKLYATWKEIYTVTFDAVEGNFADGSQQKEITGIVIGNPVAEITEQPTRTGHIFKGWYTEKNGAGVKYNFSTPVTGSFTLYAYWEKAKYTITYHPQGGTVTPTSEEKEYLEYITPMPMPIRTGYIFEGWDTKVDGSGTRYNAGQSFKLTKNIELYAQWKKALVVNFHINDGSGAVTQVEPNASGKVTVITPTARSQFYFEGWYTNSNGTGTRYTPGQEITVTNNMDLYAKWTRTRIDVNYQLTNDTVILTFNENIDRLTNVSRKKGLTGLLENMAMGFSSYNDNGVIRYRSSDVNWFGNAELRYIACEFDGHTYYNSFNDVGPGNYTIYNYRNVTFNSNGGSDVDSQTLEYGKTASRPGNPTKSEGILWGKVEYTFTGWYTNSACTNLFDFNTPITSNITLYAGWRK